MAGDGRGRGTALLVSVVLATIAGYVDAVGFARLLGVFPANQSGNVIFLGMAIGGHGPAPGWRTATAIVCFGLGVALGFVAGRRLGGRRRGPVLLGSELVALLVVVAISGRLDHDGIVTGFSGFMLVALTSAAMGVQTEAIRHVAGVAIATTYESGVLVRIGEVMSAPFRQGRAARYAKQLGVLASVLLAYLGGAALGASTVGRWGWSLLVPCAVLAVLTTAWMARPDWFAAIGDDPASD